LRIAVRLRRRLRNQHRRRLHGDINAPTDVNDYGYSYSDADRDCHGNVYANATTNSDANRNSYCNSKTYA
jgi:hypothetical protein